MVFIHFIKVELYNQFITNIYPLQSFRVPLGAHVPPFGQPCMRPWSRPAPLLFSIVSSSSQSPYPDGLPPCPVSLCCGNGLGCPCFCTCYTTQGVSQEGVGSVWCVMSCYITYFRLASERACLDTGTRMHTCTCTLAPQADLILYSNNVSNVFNPFGTKGEWNCV